MMMKWLFSLLVLLTVHTVASAQTWEKRELGGLNYEFPTPSQKINAPDAFGVTYSGDNIFLTVTSLPDTTDFKPETQLARSRYYAATAASVTIKMHGKMVEAKDSMIEDEHLYFSVIEVLMPDSAISKYELLQYLEKDTLHGFSCQYIVADKAATQLRDHFFSSITFSPQLKMTPLTEIIIGGTVLVFVVAFLFIRKMAKAK